MEDVDKATAITDIGNACVNHYIYTSVDRVGCLPNLFIASKDGMGGHKAGDIASFYS